ncbi:MAG: Tim44 domain-containing protein [Rhodospirillales bacterium]|nr:Tim44 domain-containing protein [Rhodospirillales bacterium]
MSDSFQFIDIVLFALVAGFLILRLRSVLGRRDGHENRTPDPFAPRPKPEHAGEQANDKVVRLPERGERPGEAPPSADVPVTGSDGPLEVGLTQIKIADPAFDSVEFISGARIAFELILNAFVAGDEKTLKPLLSPEVYENFTSPIQERQASGQRLDIKLVSLRSADIVEAYMAGRTAHVTVRFLSEQISATYDAADAVVDGDPSAVTEVTDYWTFARDTRSPDPNWTLVATDSAE